MDLAMVTSYRVPRTRTELSLTPGERVVGGGTWLFSEPQPDVNGLVDLQGLGWPVWEELPDGGVRIGATATIAQLLAAPWPDAPWPEASAQRLAAQCADALLMSFKVQRAATVGGNLALALPAGAMIALTAALGGEVVVWRAGGERRQPVEAFVVGPGATTLATGEVIRAIELPGSSLRARTAFRRLALSEHGRSGIVVVGRRDAGSSDVTITITGATGRPVVLRLPADATPADVRALTRRIEVWYEDPHGAADWKAAVSTAFAEEILAELAEERR
ncbi:FAD binding domain-containing protein [Nocardioides sp. BP30]|uniref:FAD binding domain-containing protein n=1 Tax=Nocardioides sp. BP30 TaxID=3036374 RepID=UPI002468886B|nr:FAD binding domain-containing protein [Nocardioides sp. BP30]WGL52623.1 FAD binding domain-containing protein [Nocardioides sp. BP30]